MPPPPTTTIAFDPSSTRSPESHPLPFTPSKDSNDNAPQYARLESVPELKYDAEGSPPKVGVSFFWGGDLPPWGPERHPTQQLSDCPCINVGLTADSILSELPFPHCTHPLHKQNGVRARSVSAARWCLPATTRTRRRWAWVWVEVGGIVKWW